MEKKVKDLGKRLGSLDDLPEELKKQLQSKTRAEFELKIYNVIIELDGIATLDEILVGYYRKHNEVLKKTFLTNKLYKMIKEGMIYSEKKGEYQIRE